MRGLVAQYGVEPFRKVMSLTWGRSTIALLAGHVGDRTRSFPYRDVLPMAVWLHMIPRQNTTAPCADTALSHHCLVSVMLVCVDGGR
jgi:hypothetical protein